MRITDSGVRSSWEALATNRRSASNADCSRASISSKVSANSATSSRGPVSAIRWSSDDSDSALAALVSVDSGRSVRPMSTQDSRPPVITSSGNAISPTTSTVSRPWSTILAASTAASTVTPLTRTSVPAGKCGSAATTRPTSR